MNKRTNKKQPGEKSLDAVELNREVPEDYRETTEELENVPADTSQNWSQPEDRSEELINETDPFIQQPERDTEIPPEMVQQRAYRLYEQRSGGPGDNLADWFEAERQLRAEAAAKKK
ncbi:MAG: DUF2934 domain-containing protein [Candidatus Omnitrophica bacterium]|nr:DUF2934 domain-containing protein [Candidatus Omnitrophota bacterium]MDE2221447.1 DUF2934 domain-containing protein [Candidatus Omnitrophota bacterium]